MEPENCKKEAKTQGDLNTFTGEWKVYSDMYYIHFTSYFLCSIFRFILFLVISVTFQPCVLLMPSSIAKFLNVLDGYV